MYEMGILHNRNKCTQLSSVSLNDIRVISPILHFYLEAI